MIPRLRPAVGARELAATLAPASRDDVARFERAFAGAMGLRHALAFRYGRTALFALLRGLALKDASVVVQGYTCSVVPHAIVLSGNRPRFVDIRLDDYNQDLDQLDDAIDERTRVVVLTHLYGCPADIGRAREVVDRKAARFGQRIYVVQDLAHAFAPTWQGQPVALAADVALWGLGISKLITSVFGGVVATSDPELAGAIERARTTLVHSARGKAARSRAYFIAATAALTDGVYGGVRWLDDNTPLLSRFTKAYHLDGKIHLPDDAFVAMTGFEAAIGLSQLARLNDIISSRRALAAVYDRALADVPGIALPPARPGSTYSHYAVRVPDRDAFIRAGLRRGVHFGTVIDYSMPSMEAYLPYTGGATFPNSDLCSRNMINLPIHAGVDDAAVGAAVAAVRDAVRR